MAKTVLHREKTIHDTVRTAADMLSRVLWKEQVCQDMRVHDNIAKAIASINDALNIMATDLQGIEKLVKEE